MKMRLFGAGVIALAALGLVLSAGTAQAATPDHYKCYKAKETKKRCLGDVLVKCKTDQNCTDAGASPPCLGFPKGVQATLTDQYENAELFDIKKPKSICAPVDKNGEGILDPVAHYKRYQIKKPKGAQKHVRQFLVAEDQFGIHGLQTIKEESILLPTGKSMLGPADELLTDHDHYKCYKVKEIKKKCTGDFTTKCKVDGDCAVAGGICYLGLAKGLTVSLTDQFEDKVFDLKKLKLVCTPVDKNGGGIVNNTDHLVGYQIKSPKGSPKHGKIAGIFANNQFGPEVLSTIKEEWLLVPAIKNGGAAPVCGNDVAEPPEDCDGTDDAACPGLCSSFCTCPASHPFTLDSTVSGATVAGALGPGTALPLAGFTGAISIDVGGPEIAPGVFPITVPVGALPPVNVLGISTVCTFFEEDPSLPGSGISGTGILNCAGIPLPAPPSPDFALHQDHCSAGVPALCDSFPVGPDACGAGAVFGTGSLLDATGICVPETPPDPACVLIDPATGATASPDLTHPPECNSPAFLVPGAAPWVAGDAFLTLNVSLDIRGPADPCVGPPIAAANVLPFTTGKAESTMMDAFAAPGLTQAIGLTGTPFSCPAVLNSTTSGAAIVTSFPATDQALLGPPVDVNTAVIFKAL